MEWKNVAQIAVHLGISKETVYRLLEAKEIPAHRIGKLWKFDTSQVDTWVKKGMKGDKKDVPKRSRKSFKN